MKSLFSSRSLIQKQLLHLLRMGLGGNLTDPELFAAVSYKDWKKIMQLAAVQGVFGLSYDGMIKLPKECRPSRDLLIGWGMGTKQIENRYHDQYYALQSLATLYRKNDIRCLLIKGIGISLLYPVPEHRESGDLDIYLFGDYEKGNRLMEEAGIKVDYQDSVHSKFEFQKTPVENHLSFQSLNWHQVDRDFEALLQQKLLEETSNYDEKIGVYFPSLPFNLLLLYKHAIKHFIFSGIVLRHLCDLALLMKQCNDTEVYPAFYESMKKFELHRYVDVFNSIAFEILGLPEDRNICLNQDYKLSQKILDDIFLQKNHPDIPRRNYFQLFQAKWMGIVYFLQRRWKFEIINKTMFSKDFILRLQIGLKHFREFKN